MRARIKNCFWDANRHISRQGVGMCRSDGVPYRRAGLGTKAEVGQDTAPEGANEPDPAPRGEPIEARNRRLSNTTAAKAAVGAWDFRSGVPYMYGSKQPGGTATPGSSLIHEPQLTRTERPPPVPKLAPLPPAPGVYAFWHFPPHISLNPKKVIINTQYAAFRHAHPPSLTLAPPVAIAPCLLVRYL